MAQLVRPNVRAADTHHDIDALFGRVDEAVGKGHVWLQLMMAFDVVEDDRQYVQPPVGRRQVDTHSASRLEVVLVQRQLRFFEVGQHP
ncbi:hypothetical protein D3C79_809940 [compost metagenome]